MNYRTGRGAGPNFNQGRGASYGDQKHDDHHPEKFDDDRHR